jgi:hypothetical protein
MTLASQRLSGLILPVPIAFTSVKHLIRVPLPLRENAVMKSRALKLGKSSQRIFTNTI